LLHDLGRHIATEVYFDHDVVESKSVGRRFDPGPRYQLEYLLKSRYIAPSWTSLFRGVDTPVDTARKKGATT